MQLKKDNLMRGRYLSINTALLLVLALLSLSYAAFGASETHHKLQHAKGSLITHQPIKRYVPMVRNSAKRYKVDASLILAIITVESNFNPRAVGYAQGLGLMQVVPETAGRDVFTHIKKRSGQPTRNYLFNPANNIDIGTAYLHWLEKNYFSPIKNPISRRYLIISAYNSGPNSVLRIFARDKNKAVKTINALSPTKLYRVLTTRHPSPHTRNYLLEVNRIRKSY